LGKIDVAKLTSKRITTWFYGVAEAPARLRTQEQAQKRNVRAINEKDADTMRRRRSSANRVLTVLKAALNLAWNEGRVSSDTAWRRVKPFHNVDAPVVRYLTEAECTRLINACPADLCQIVQGALVTGCRYGELSHLTVQDFDPDAGTVAVRVSKSGKPRHVVLTDEGKVFFEQAVMGKQSPDLIFTHDDGKVWGKSHQSRPLLEACKNAKIKPAISFHVLRHTHGSLLAMQGVPMPVIAQQLGHSDTRMTEKHYAHLSPSYVADTIRQNFPTLGVLKNNNVSRFAN
jgi:integrase